MSDFAHILLGFPEYHPLFTVFSDLIGQFEASAPNIPVLKRSGSETTIDRHLKQYVSNGFIGASRLESFAQDCLHLHFARNSVSAEWKPNPLQLQTNNSKTHTQRRNTYDSVEEEGESDDEEDDHEADDDPSCEPDNVDRR
jgi:hypothetical protein